MKEIDLALRKRLRSRFDKWKKTKRGISIIAGIYARQQGACNACGNFTPFYLEDEPFFSVPVYASIDHIIPLSRGGTNDPSNLQILCNRCNGSKGVRYHGAKKITR